MAFPGASDAAFILSSVWFALIMWLIFRAFSQQGALQQVAAEAPNPSDRPNPPDRPDAPDLAVIIPARNESANIGRCLRSVMAQDYQAGRMAVIVVDDDSSDDTAKIVTALAHADNRITLVSAPPLPPNWQGKVNACCAGAQRAAAGTDWLCFIDADMRAEPHLIASSLDTAIAQKLDLLSLAPRHDLKSFAERLILPCGHYLLSFIQDLAKVQAPDSEEATATGQFMLLRRRAYDSVGGHAAVRSAICEDLELARLLKKRGHHVLLFDGSKVLSTRMYTGWRTLWPGIAKNLVDMLGGPVPTVITALMAVVVAWGAVLLPAVDLYACSGGSTLACAAAVPASLGAFAAFGLHIAGARYFQIPLWYGFLFPAGYTAGALIALDSLRWRLTRRVRWKGRVYQ